MNTRFSLALIAAVWMTSPTAAQWDDPMGRYTGTAPQFCYYAVDGVDAVSGAPIPAGSFTIRNAGLNGVVDSTDNAVIGGDDYGFIAIDISVQFPYDDQAVLALPAFADGIFWDFFNLALLPGIQLSGAVTPGVQFLPVSASETVLWTMEPGLDATAFTGPSGFVEIETSYNLQEGVQGGTLFSVGDPIASGIFSVVGHVPEPSSLSLACVSLLMGLGFWRRRNPPQANLVAD